MALKWAGILVSAVTITLAVTANAVAGDEPVPDLLTLVSVVTAAAATVVAIVADLYVRLDAKLDRLHGAMVARFDQLDAETGDRNSGFVEGYLLGHPAEGAVVPIAPRNRRAATGED